MASLCQFERRFLLYLPRLLRQRRPQINIPPSITPRNLRDKSLSTTSILIKQTKVDVQDVTDSNTDVITQDNTDAKYDIDLQKEQDESAISKQDSEMKDRTTTQTVKIIRTSEDKTTRFTEDIFEMAEKDGKSGIDTFETAIRLYAKNAGKYMRGHAEFITKALTKLKDYNLHKEIRVYKLLFLLMPEGKYKPKTRMQVEFFHYPKEQTLAISILDEMESNGVIPDQEVINMVDSRFSDNSHVFKKVQRMLYWMPKFKHINPYPVPFHLPDNRVELAKIALIRMSHDQSSKIRVWKTSEVDDLAEEDTFIVSSQSPQQQRLLQEHSRDKPLYVEGGFHVYLRNCVQTYFVLRADPLPVVEHKIGEYTYDIEEFCNSKLFFDDEEPTAIVTSSTVHEQEDGVVMAMCITGTNCQSSLTSWIRCLQQNNPKLDTIPVLFKLKDPDQLLKETENNMEALS